MAKKTSLTTQINELRRQLQEKKQTYERELRTLSDSVNLADHRLLSAQKNLAATTTENEELRETNLQLVGQNITNIKKIRALEKTRAVLAQNITNIFEEQG